MSDGSGGVATVKASRWIAIIVGSLAIMAACVGYGQNFDHDSNQDERLEKLEARADLNMAIATDLAVLKAAVCRIEKQLEKSARP